MWRPCPDGPLQVALGWGDGDGMASQLCMDGAPVRRGAHPSWTLTGRCVWPVMSQEAEICRTTVSRCPPARPEEGLQSRPVPEREHAPADQQPLGLFPEM